MRHLSMHAAMLVGLACGGTTVPAATSADPPASAPDDPSSPPAAIPGTPEGDTAPAVARSSPGAATTAYLDAAMAMEFEAMYALMTPKCRDEERVWAKGLTKNLADGRVRLRTYRLGEPEITADTATVEVQARLAADVTEPERVHFDLEQEPEGWVIVAIR